jgi:hypothetical protein
MSNSKILVSGCGISFSKQEKKTWPNILQAVGVDIVDASGPAVSNQWILDNAISVLLSNHDIRAVVLQLTYLNKLDVEITNDERQKNLVEPDPIRNFTWQDVWPSSSSTVHPSKQLWQTWLASPGLELKSIYVKLKLLEFWCQQHNIKLKVYQGYELPWNPDQQSQLNNIISNIEYSWMSEYKNQDYVDLGNQKNSVPNLFFQLNLAKKVATDLQLNISDRLERLTKAVYDTQT